MAIKPRARHDLNMNNLVMETNDGDVPLAQLVTIEGGVAVPFSSTAPEYVVIYGTTSSGTKSAIRIDKSTNALKVIDYAHSEIHSGSHFCYISAVDFSNGQVLPFLVTTPNTTKWSHFGFTVTGEAEYDILMYEDATPAADGSAVSNPAVINQNRNSSTLPTLTITSPTLGGGSKGTLLAHFHAGSGKTVGGVSGTGEEFILKQNTKYWFDVTNATTSANYISWVVEWYEHTDLA